MRAFAEAWPDRAIVQQSVAQLPWGQNVQLLDSLKTRALREWYARKALEYGWSRSMLAVHIESGLHAREGKAATNFPATLPPPQSDLAQQALKIPISSTS
jgi:predicted nuclease of restriction endonuclease-like (RecB) superfamily